MSKKNKKTIENSVSRPTKATGDGPVLVASRYTKEDKWCFAGLILLILIVILIRSNFLEIPYERDEGAYTHYGIQTLDGQVPYKDFYEQKFPGIFYFFACMVALFGTSVREMHIGFIFLNIGTIVLVFLSVRKLFAPIPALLSAITFAFVSITANLSGFTVQAEHGVAFFTALGIFLYVIASDRQKGYWYYLMGFAFGSAFMVKTSGVFLMFWGGLILITDFLTRKDKNFKSLVPKVLFYIAGACTIVIGLLLTVILRGGLEDMIFWVYEIPKYYVNRIQLSEGIKYFGYARDAIILNHKFFWVHGFAGLFVCLLPAVPWKTKLFLISLGALSFLTIVPGYYFYGHYWIQLIPGLAVLSGATFHYVMLLFGKFKANALFNVKYVYAGIFILLTLKHIHTNKSYYFNPNYQLILRNVYGNNPFPETMEIARYLNGVSAPEDKIVAFGSEPQLYIYTNRLSPTRHLFFSTIVASIPEHKQFQREYVSEIEKAKPKYFVFYRHSVSLLVQANTDQYVFEWANKYLSENYNVIGVVDMPDGQLQSTYVWGAEAQTFAPKGQNVIYIFERKTST